MKKKSKNFFSLLRMFAFGHEFSVKMLCFITNFSHSFNKWNTNGWKCKVYVCLYMLFRDDDNVRCEPQLLHHVSLYWLQLPQGTVTVEDEWTIDFIVHIEGNHSKNTPTVGKLIC